MTVYNLRKEAKMSAGHTSLIDPIIEQVQSNPDQLAVTVVHDDETEETITRIELHEDSGAVSQALQRIGIETEDIFIIALDHSRSRISSFWGILYACAVPSIFPYPVPGVEPDVYLKQVMAMIVGSGARAVVTTDSYEPELAAMLHDSDCRVLNIDSKPNGNLHKQTSLPGSHTAKEQIAYLQYTSGTTGLQKGVLLSHRAILNFVSTFTGVNAICPEDVIVNWLPLYHDYGLFTGLVFPMLLGIPTVIISPFKWIRNPKTLLWAIHKHKGTFCWMPNFAFAHLAGSIREGDLEGLDLSHLRIAGSGGEPIIYHHQQIFLKRLNPYGMSEKVLGTGYGMAENTLAATASLLEARAPVDWVDVKTLQEGQYASPSAPDKAGSIPVVSCGIPVRGAEVSIVTDEELPLGERNVGEIIIRTNTLINGYHQRPDLYAQVMRDGWFYTGDLGYMAEGHLYVCGRKKDLIIIGGKNIHPEDLEAVADKVHGIAPGRAAAFGVMDKHFGSERIVMVCDLKGSFDEAEKQDSSAARYSRN